MRRDNAIVELLNDVLSSELTSVITQTIDQWDGQEASRRIELHVEYVRGPAARAAPR